MVFANTTGTLVLEQGQITGDATGLVGSMGTVNATNVETYDFGGLFVYPGAMAYLAPAVAVKNNVSFFIQGNLGTVGSILPPHQK